MTGTLWRSALVVALFAVHPLRAESVAWVAERKDTLSTLFALLTLAAYLGYVRHPRWDRYLLVALIFGLGLLAKPMLVTLPCVLLLLDYWPLNRWRSGSTNALSAVRLVREKWPLFVLASASSVVTVWAQRAGGAVATLDEYSIGNRVAGAVVAYVRYLGMTVFSARTGRVLSAASAAVTLFGKSLGPDYSS